MNDFNQSEQLHLEFGEYPTMNNVPSFEQMMTKKTIVNDGGFDPHKLMINRKREETGEIQPQKQSWPERDIKTLEDFCLKYGIIGFNSGKMSPIAALALLKQKLGVIDSPAENRVTYSDSINKKILLTG